MRLSKETSYIDKRINEITMLIYQTNFRGWLDIADALKRIKTDLIKLKQESEQE